MSIMFKKKGGARSNLRRKKGSDEEESGNEGGGSEAPQPPIPLIDTPTHVKPTAGVLSFEDDIEIDGPAFRVKKSSHSRKLGKMKKKMKKHKEEKKEEDDDAIEIVEKPLVLPHHPPLHTPKEEPENDNGTAEINAIKFSSRRGKQNENPLSRTLQQGSIPDAKMVHMARKQRQRARDGEEVIPLDDTQRFRKEKSRLVREDDENDESDLEEDGGKFYSKKMLIAEEEEKRKKTHAQFLDVEQGESDDERDEEFERWEQEQIKKGVSAQQLNSMQQEQIYSSQFTMEDRKYYSLYGTMGPVAGDQNGYSTSNDVHDPQPMELEMDIVPSPSEYEEKPAKKGRKKGTTTIPLPPAPSTNIPISLQSLLDKMKINVTEREAFGRERFLEREKAQDHLSDAQANISRLEELEPKLKDQYRLFQEMRTYSRDLLDCFNEKLEEITKLEEAMHNLLESRSQFLIRRRRQDVRDQFEECSQSASGKSKGDVKESEKMMRTAEREARRGRRRQGRENRVGGAKHHEGLSSDDEEAPSRTVSLNNEFLKLVADANLVLNDAHEDYSTVGAICEKFTTWLYTDRSSFEEAYIVLCLPKLLSPLIRLELISWDPIESTSVSSLSEHLWLSEALRFGGPGATDKEDSEESERSVIVGLIPGIVEKVIIPKLTALLGAWDITSRSRTERVAQLLKHVTRIAPTITPDSSNVQRLLQVIQSRVKDSLDDDLFTPIYSKETLENTTTGCKTFLDRQFWFALKVFKNLLLLEGFLSTRAAQELVFDGILNRHLVLGLQCSVLTDSSVIVKCKAVVEAIPSSWVEKGNLNPVELEPLFKLLQRIAEECSKSRVDGGKDIYRLFVKLGAKERAEQFMVKPR